MPIRVAAVVGNFPTLSETFLYTTFENLRAAGIEVRIYARRRGHAPHHINLPVTYLPAEDAFFPLKLLALGAAILRCAIRSPRQAVHLLRHFSTRRQQESWTWRHLLRVLHRTMPLLLDDADSLYFAHGSLAVTYREIFGLRPACLSLRGSDINIEPLISVGYAAQLSEVLRLAQGIHCVCAELKTRAETLVGAPLPHAHVIYTALNPIFLEADAAQPSAAPGVVTLFSVGRLDWRKGYEHGLVAFRHLLDQGVRCRWLIAGEGEYRLPIDYAIRDMGLSEHVTLLGGLSQSDLLQHLRQADIFFHPAVSEGLNNAVLEAMALGLPVVCTDVGGMSEAVQQGSTGLLVPPRHWRAMADALRRLIDSPSLRQQLGQAAREQVRARFTAAQQQQGFLEFFSPSGGAS